MTDKRSPSAPSPHPFSRFIAPQPFRWETGDGATVVTTSGAIYKLEGVLGVGGLNIVYSATRYSDGQTVAVKLPNANAKSCVDAVALLNREGRILSRFDHDNIVRLLDHGQTLGGEPFLAMDLVRAQTLDMLMVPNGGRLPLMRAGNICLQVCDALAHAHERGIIHRDIKPPNVLVRTCNGTDRIMLFDFGIASIDGDETEVADSGSILYASPEQLENRVCTSAADIYQVALLLFEMLTGNLPFEREIFEAVKYRQGERPLLPDDKDLGERAFPPGIRELLLEALSPEAEKRPASMKVFGFRLRQMLTRLRVTHLRLTGEDEKVPA